MDCVFCQNDGGQIIFSNSLFRVVLVDDKDYPGFLRVILNRHTKELTDLTDNDNLKLYSSVMACEKSIREVMTPDKINIASFGNMTPHVHWHIIPRFIGDKHFPNPIWGEVINANYVPSQQLTNQVIKLIQNLNNKLQELS